MHKSLISKFFILLLVVGLLGGATGQAKAADIDVNAPITRAANQLVATQMKSGGWGQDELTSPTNIGPAGIGLALAYERIEDQAYYNALFGKDPDNGVADYLLSKTDNFAPGDGLIAFYLDQIENVKTYSEFVNTNYFQKLADGTYNGMGYDAYLPTLQASAYQWLNSEDVATGMLSAFLVGADYKPWSQAVFNTLDSIVAGQGMEFLVVSKSIFALQFVGETTFVPSNGAYVGLSLYDIASQVVAYQMSNGAIPTDSDWNTEEDILATIFTILAIDKIDATTFNAKIEAAVQWLITTQDSDGDFVGGPLLSKNSGTNGLAIWALDEAYPAVPAEVLCTTACYVSPTGSDTAMGNEATPFATIQKAVTTVAPGGTVHVAAGTYVESVEIVDKDLTLLGASGATIQSPVEIPARDGTSWKAIIFVHHANATIDGFTIDGAGRGNQNSRFLGVQFFEADGVLKNSTVTNVTWTPFAGTQEGIGFYAYNAVEPARSVSLLDNTFVNNQKGDVNIYGSPLNVSIEGNTFTGRGNTSILAQNGVSFQGGATGFVKDNTFSGYSYSKEPPDQWNWGAAGLLMYQAGDVTLGGDNSFTGNDNHLYIYDSGTVVMGAEDFGPSTAPADFGYFVVNANDAPLDLTNSSFQTTDPFELALRIWDGIDKDGYGLASFEDGHVYVNTDGSIQRAIDLATAGDTIHVEAGTYKEALLVNKAVTLLGPNAAIDPNADPSGRVLEAIIQGTTTSGLSQKLEIDTQDVEIKGFTFDNMRIDNYNGQTGSNTLLIGDVKIENNIFTNVLGTAIYLRDGRDAPGVYCSGVSISNNKIVSPASAGTVDYNAGSGIVFMGGDSSTISGNVITDAAYNGLQIARSKDLTIGNNIATGAVQPALQIAQWNAGTFAISDNTFSTISTEKAAVRLYGFANNYYPLFNFTGNTIQDSKFGIQIGHGDPKAYNDIRDADYSFAGNIFTGITTDKLVVYLDAQATEAELAEMNALFAQVYGTGAGARLTTSANPFTYKVGCGINCYVSPTGSDSNPGLETAPFLTIQKGIDSVSVGGTVNVAAGTYIENVLVNKHVSVIGAGSGTDGTIVTTPAGFDTKVGVFQITGSGIDSTDPLLLQDIRIEPVGQSGISVGRFTESTGQNVSYLTLDNIYVMGSYYAPATEQERGFYVDLTSTVDHLTVTDSVFTRLTYGWYLQKAVSAETSTVSNVSVRNTIFSFNAHKGIYAEKLTEAVFEDCTIDNNGSDDTVLPVYFNDWKAGVDLNLKAGAYANISFINCAITNNGTGQAKEGVGIAIKARNDATSYNTFAASLDNVQIIGGTVTGNERGIRIGEPNKVNDAINNVIIHGVQVYGNLKVHTGPDGSPYGDVINLSPNAVDATGNWWGQAVGPTMDQVVGTVASCGWLDAAPPTGVAVPKPVLNSRTGLGHCTIQAAIDDPLTLNGDTITVAAGTYVEELRINKSVTLLGPNADINPNTGDRVEEAVIKSSVDGAVITQVTGVSIKGFTFDGQGTSDSAIYAYDGAGSVVIENNILMNHDYGALVFYNYTNSGGVTTNNIIKNNKIETVTGTYGLGMLLYNNFYAEVTGNVISDVRVGIQTGNYYRANTGAPATLSDNQITANRRGIFHNLHYSDASAFTITGNIIIAQDLATGTTFDGIMLSSLQTAVDAIVTNNTITIGNITQSPTTGYMIWNTPTTATLSVEGGTVSGADYGVWVNNYEGYSSDAHSTSVTIDGVTITGAEIGVYVKDSPDNTNGATVSAIIKNNSITAATGIKVEGADATASGDHNMVYATTDVENTNPVSMNFENNYWGSPCGATVVGVVDTIPWFEDEAMLVSKETNPSGNLTLTPDMTTLAINNTLACAAPYSTITFTTTTEDVEYPGNIIIPEGRDHLKIVLTDGVKIQATSPCFTVEADYTTIKAENIGMAACVTAAGSNGIDVADGVVNLTVDGLEIYGPGNDGIHFNGVITDVVLKDNLIHDLAGNGVFFGAQPVAQTVGAIDIHGNMFQNNALNGIEAGAFTVPAEYNSWGNVAGAAAGDGASSGVVADPFTHVDIYLESSGTPWANQVVSGQTITYTVMGHLVNASGADFVLTYPENLTYVSSTAPKTFGLLDAVTHTAGSRSLQFMGYSTTGNKTGTLPLFNVTFTAGTPVVAAPMLLNELTDGFTMDVVGSSNNIYAAALLDSSVTIVTLPTISSADIQGYYLTGEQRQFSVVLDNPSTGADYAHVYVDFTMTNAQVEQISLIEYSVDNGTTWVALGTGPGTSFANVGTDIVGYFGKVTGGGFPMAPGASLPTLFRVTFVTREQGAIDFPTSYAVSMKLMDADAAIQLDDFAATMQVYDKPTITSTDIQGYYLTGEQREFHVTGANPLTGKNYSNVMYKIILPNTVIADITNIQYYETYPTTGYVPLALTQDGANVVAWFGLASYGGFPMAPGFSDSPSFLVTFATAKEYSVLIEQYDVALEPDRLLVAETFTADVYTPPVITATFPTGPYAAGVPVTVDVDITNPSSIPAPFELVFDLPAGTVISYGGTDYVCAATCPPIVVTLPLVDGQFSITFDEAWTGTAGLSLFDSDWTPADRLLATASQTGVVVNDDFAVTGTFSMQGRSTRAGIPVTLTWGGALGPYTKSANTIDAISNNFSLTLTYGGTYTVTTAQPRYLNVTTANAKTLSVPLALGKTMNPLELKAGNAKWDDNIINDQDSGMIASGYIQGITLFPNADVNFDNKINIQDLALVGGNYFVDSTVYNSWIVVTP